MTDRYMVADDRMKMERCMTQNFLLKFGMDVFGKRDLLYIDMRGDRDIARMHDMEELPEPYNAVKAEKLAKAAAADEGGDDGGDDAGDDDEWVKDKEEERLSEPYRNYRNEIWKEKIVLNTYRLKKK